MVNTFDLTRREALALCRAYGYKRGLPRAGRERDLNWQHASRPVWLSHEPAKGLPPYVVRTTCPIEARVIAGALTDHRRSQKSRIGQLAKPEQSA